MRSCSGALDRAGVAVSQVSIAVKSLEFLEILTAIRGQTPRRCQRHCCEAIIENNVEGIYDALGKALLKGNAFVSENSQSAGMAKSANR